MVMRRGESSGRPDGLGEHRAVGLSGSLASPICFRGEDAPPHPLGLATAESLDPGWSRSLYSAAWTGIGAPVEDLSE